MKFKSKTALAEHIKDLELNGYLTAIWHKEPSTNNKTRILKTYQVNYTKVTEGSS